MHALSGGDATVRAVAQAPINLRQIDAREVEEWLDRLFVAAEGASLRREDRRKAIEVAAMLAEVARAVARVARARDLVVVDAAAGKTYVGLLAAKLVIEPLGRPARVVAIEREPARAAAGRAAIARLATPIPIDCIVGDVADAAMWPAEPAIVCALHACGPAADAIIDRAVASGARQLLLVPCCTSDVVPGAAVAARVGAELGIPRHAPVRRRFVQALVDALRTLRLEAAGFQTEVVELCAPTVTPHNLLWRARRVGEPARMAEARAALSRLGG